jgi:hypothetical protein
MARKFHDMIYKLTTGRSSIRPRVVDRNTSATLPRAFSFLRSTNPGIVYGTMDRVKEVEAEGWTTRKDAVSVVSNNAFAHPCIGV